MGRLLQLMAERSGERVGCKRLDGEGGVTKSTRFWIDPPLYSLCGVYI